MSEDGAGGSRLCADVAPLGVRTGNIGVEPASDLIGEQRLGLIIDYPQA